MQKSKLFYNVNKRIGDYYNMLYKKLTKKEQILRLHKSGMKQADIARELKTYTNYVWKVVTEQNRG